MASVQHKTTAKGRGRARLLVAALIGALLLNPPVLEIFSRITTFRPFGWPLVMIYINLVWLLLILLVLFPKRRKLPRNRPVRGPVASKGRE
ncbi:hypothetical protein [Sedimenticola thiotaurini]|uniref:DUF3311 domain-containing protein n=1 Tax=Sedimenticola thiotaurini TaxID=1543721 RepID=A0A0F7K040_9GAMM|nr:hypothetical protein [Sedimenticola thiotaurini]AKH20964.1 hypothetical protein AAY24_12080 [Sedimenticola thiotaurini]